MREIQIRDRAGNAVRSSGAQVFASALAAWQGLPIDLHSLHGSGEVGPTSAPFPTIAVCLEGRSGYTDVHSGHRRVRLPFLSGVSVVQEQDFEIDRAAWYGIAVDQVMTLQIPPDIAGGWDGEGGAGISTCMPVRDDTLLTFATAIRDELDRGCTSGRMFAQGISMAFAGYVQARYGAAGAARATDSRHASGKLSTAELAKVGRFIDEHMARDIGVEDLSGLLALSPSRFSRLFAATTGVSPYRFLQQQRVERALTLLRGPCTLAEIAQVVGFSSQSHFTQMFRRLIGTTPARLRAQLCGRKGGAAGAP